VYSKGNNSFSDPGEEGRVLIIVSPAVGSINIRTLNIV
jgi:hypothetical protein